MIFLHRAGLIGYAPLFDIVGFAWMGPGAGTSQNFSVKHVPRMCFIN